MVSEKQRAVIVALGSGNENRNIADQTLGISREAMNKRRVRAFNGFVEDLEMFHEYFDVFKKDFQRTPKAYTMLRSIARRIRI